MLAIVTPEAKRPAWNGELGGSTVVTIRPGSQVKSPLFCVHAEAGDVSLYYNLAAHLAGDRPVLGLATPARDAAWQGNGLRALAGYHVGQIKAVQPEGPYLLVGECTGGALAYEIALQLRGAGEQLGLLALIDAFAPGMPRLRRFMPKALYRLIHRARILAFHFVNVLRLGGAEKLSYVGSRAGRLLGKLPSRSLPASGRSGASPQSEFREAVAGYVPAPYDGSIVLFRASELPVGIERAPDMGWGSLAGNVEVEMVSGYFTTPISEPAVRILAERLSARLMGVAERP